MGPNVTKLASSRAAFCCMRARARQSIMHSMLMQRNAVTIRGARPADLVTQMLAMEELTWAATGPGGRK